MSAILDHKRRQEEKQEQQKLHARLLLLSAGFNPESLEASEPRKIPAHVAPFQRSVHAAAASRHLKGSAHPRAAVNHVPFDVPTCDAPSHVTSSLPARGGSATATAVAAAATPLINAGVSSSSSAQVALLQARVHVLQRHLADSDARLSTATAEAKHLRQRLHQSELAMALMKTEKIGRKRSGYEALDHINHVTVAPFENSISPCPLEGVDLEEGCGDNEAELPAARNNTAPGNSPWPGAGNQQDEDIRRWDGASSAVLLCGLGTSLDVVCEMREAPEDVRMCKKCKVQEATVLMLPCRHIAACKACDKVLECCPVCKEKRQASIHVNT